MPKGILAISTPFHLSVQNDYTYLDYQVTVPQTASQVMNTSQVLLEFVELNCTSLFGYVWITTTEL